MKKTLLFVLVSLFAAAQSPSRWALVDSSLNRLITNGTAPNAVTMVIHQGKVVHHKAYGFKNIEKNQKLQTNNIFRIASQSKLITTIGLLMLWEEGKFHLEEPVWHFIPAFKNPKVLVDAPKDNLAAFTTRPAKSDVTIRQLLSHTSGIPYGHPLENLPEYKVPFFNSTEADKLENVVNKIAARPLLADPGEKFIYGLSTDVAGRLIEVISGMPLDRYFEEKIFKPLGMVDTYFYLPENKAFRLVELYSKPEYDKPLYLHKNDAYRFYPFSGAKTYFSGGAGLVSTVSDYAKACQLILNRGTLNGKRLLARHTVEMMLQNQIGNNEVWDRKDKFGLGLELSVEGSQGLEPSSPGTAGWGGMYCSDYMIDSRENLVLLVFTNAEPYAHFTEFVKKFRATVYQAIK